MKLHAISKKSLTEYTEFYNIIKDIFSNSTVQEMRNYRQHYQTSTFEHCFKVSLLNYKICKKIGLDYKAAARAGMVHDLFLYDWRKSSKNLDGLHAFVHPKIAAKNAGELFYLTDKEKDIIVNHMWPVTFFHFPKYRESFIITLTDKYSAIQESFSFYNSFLTKKRIYKYAYIFLCLLIFV